MKRYIGLVIGVGIIACILYIFFGRRSLDFAQVNTDLVIDHMVELSSPKYQGRSPGSVGNEATMAYIEAAFSSYGIKEVPEELGLGNIGYRQPFNLIVPDIDLNPSFMVYGQDDDRVLSFDMYRDYNALPYYMGGGLDFDGPVLMAGTNLLRTEPELIRDSLVVVDAGHMDAKWVQYVADHGGKGLLICTDKAGYSLARRYERTKSLSTSGKTGDSLLLGYLSKEAYDELEDILGDEKDGKQGRPLGIINRAQIHIDMEFPVVETTNIIGFIEGKGKKDQVLIISANLDNVGMASESTHFPGTLSKTSGLAGLLEIARILGSLEGACEESILFVAFNGQEADMAGTEYFIRNLDLNPDFVRHIHIDGIGEDSYDPISLAYNPNLSTILGQQMAMYGQDQEIQVASLPALGGTIAMFGNASIPSITLSSSQVVNNLDDTIDGLSTSKLENSLKLLMAFLQHEVYGDNYIDFMTGSEKVIVGLLLFFGLVHIVLDQFIKLYPNKIFYGRRMDQIGLSSPVMILRGFYRYVFPYGVAVFVLAIIANINPETNVVIRGNRMTSNFSMYLTLKDALHYVRSLVNPATYNQETVGNILEVIQSAGSKSIQLVAGALSLAFIVGIIRGLYEGYRHKGKELRSLGSLLIFSIPDVLVVTLGLLLHTFIAIRFPDLNQRLQPGEYLFPLLTLSVIPTIYISRITYVTIHEELTKDYIRHAKALGYSKSRIYMTEMMPAILYKILDSIPAILTMVFSNMIIVEYLFNYNGVVYYLLYLYNRHDVQRFVPLAVSLGLIYIVLTSITSYIRFLLNPMKGGLKR